MQWIQCDAFSCGRWFSDNDYYDNNSINSNESLQQLSSSPSELASKFETWYCPACVPYHGIGTYKSSKRPGLRKRGRPSDFYSKLNDPGSSIGNTTAIIVSNSCSNINDDDNESLLSAISSSQDMDTTAMNIDFAKLLQTKQNTKKSWKGGSSSYFATDTIEIMIRSGGVDDIEEFDEAAIFSKHGYDHPLLFDTSITPKMLGMILPSRPFGYENVCQLVGPYRPIQVTDVATQRTVDCTLKEFVDYLLHDDETTVTSTTTRKEKKDCDDSKTKFRTRIINSITLEVSKTPLGGLVREPKFARDVDLVELHWPRSIEEIIHGRSSSRREEKKSSLSSILPTTLPSLPAPSSSLSSLLTACVVNNNLHNNELEYTTTMTEKPHVTKYCLMSAAGSYTDFHVDFGGTSVWYHVHTGAKIFYFIEPTITNMNIYTKWATNKKDQTKNTTTSVTEKYVFLPDLIHAAGGVVHEVTVKQGQTLFIPSGWFHAVFTPIDSLVFGGNFLHQQSLDMQLQIHKLENVMKVGAEFRFPYFQKLLWYTAQDFIMECTELINRSVLSSEKEAVIKTAMKSKEKSSNPSEQIAKKDADKFQLNYHHVRILCMTYPSHVLRGYGVLAKELSRWSNSRIKSTIAQYPVHIDVVAVASELGSMMRLCIAHLDKMK